MAKGSSSGPPVPPEGTPTVPSALLPLGFSNTLADFSLHSIWRVPAEASQNFTLPSACLQKF